MRNFCLTAIACLSLALTGQILEANAYQDGKRAFSRRDYKTAHAKFQQALKENPGNGDPLFYVGYMLENQRQKGEAMQAYGRAVGLNMTADLKEKAFWRLVLYYHYQKDWDNLYVYASRFQRFKPSPRVAGMLAQAEAGRDPSRGRFEELVRTAEEHDRQKDYARAALAYQNALSLRPGFHKLRWKLALALMEEKEYARANQELTQLIKAESRWEYRYKDAVCLYHLGQYRAALQQLEQAQAQNPDKGAAFQSMVALGRGLAYMELREMPQALEELNKARSEKTKNRVQQAFARYYILEGDLGRAVQAARSTGGEKQTDTTMALGLGLLREGQLMQSFQQLKEMHELLVREKTRLQYDTAYHALGKLACHFKDYALCQTAFAISRPTETRVELTHHNLLEYNSRLAANEKHYYASRIALADGSDRQALESLARITTDLRAFFERARIHARRGEASQTQELIRFLIGKNPAYRDHARKDPAISALALQHADLAALLAPHTDSMIVQPTPGPAIQIPEIPAP